MSTENQTEQKDPVITIGQKEYKASELTEQQQTMVNHVYDLRGKIASAQFGLEQLQFAEASFSKELVASVEAPVEEVETEEVTD